MRTIDKELHDAVISGNSEKVIELLRKGADPNSLHTNGYTPLMHAVREWRCTPEQRFEITRILLDKCWCKDNIRTCNKFNEQV